MPMLTLLIIDKADDIDRSVGCSKPGSTHIDRDGNLMESCPDLSHSLCQSLWLSARSDKSLQPSVGFASVSPRATARPGEQ